MTVLVACETVLLALLVLLVAGLLRSHAEILRRLGPPTEEGEDRGAELPSPARRATIREGNDIIGLTLEREPVKIGFGEGYPPTLLAFLTSGCAVCESFWNDLRDGRRPPQLPAGIRVMAVTKDPAHESADEQAAFTSQRVDTHQRMLGFVDGRLKRLVVFASCLARRLWPGVVELVGVHRPQFVGEVT